MCSSFFLGSTYAKIPEFFSTKEEIADISSAEA